LQKHKSFFFEILRIKGSHRLRPTPKKLGNALQNY
jgi:hypothetical protein